MFKCYGGGAIIVCVCMIGNLGKKRESSNGIVTNKKRTIYFSTFYKLMYFYVFWNQTSKTVVNQFGENFMEYIKMHLNGFK